MPIAAPIQNSFNSGEFSPLMYGRTDFPKYKNGLTLMQRFVPMVQGGATRCPGTKFLRRQKADGKVRLVPFVFNSGDAFMIEMGDVYLRFYQDRVPVKNATQAISAITKANPAVVTYVGADNYANGKEIYITSVVGMTQVNGRWFKVANLNAGANTFELTDLDGNNINSTSYTTYSSAGTVATVYELVSPYALADVENVRMVELNDVIYLAHPSYAPRKLSRTAANAWSFATVTFLDGPYLPLNSTTTTLTPAATTGAGVNVTASAVTGINSDTGFQTTDIGRFIRIKHASTWGYALITARTSTTVVVVTILSAFGNTTASAVWRAGEWSDTTGYPSINYLFEDRLGWGASTIAPTTLNMSKTGDYENMAPTGTDSTVAADNALQLRLNSGRQDPIRWVADDEKGMLIGTKGAEWIVKSSSTGDAISAINFPSARISTRYGSASVEPLAVGKAKLMLQSSKRKLREVQYVYEVDGFKAPDMTLLADHMTKSGVLRMTYQQEPFNLVWVVRIDGALVAMTYDREQDVIGWHRHPIGGYSDSGQSADVIIESVACVPAPDGTYDDVYISCKRYINGGTKRYIEYFSAFNTDFDSVSDAFFVDSGVAFTGAASSLTGLDHLEGQTVSILVDGSPQPTQVVSGGAVTVSPAMTAKAAVGLGFLSRIKTLRPEAGSATGTAQGKLKRIHKLAALLHQTVGCRVGRDFTTMEPLELRTGADAMSAAVPLFSGITPLDFPSDYDQDGYVCLEAYQPLPCTLLALMPQLHTQDAQ